jgi:hypothetical protein
MCEREVPAAAHEVPGQGCPGTAPAGPGAREGRRTPAARIATKLAATGAVITACWLLATATWSNLNATATNPVNTFTSGTVQLASNSTGSSLLALSNAQPGATSTGCVQLTYTGNLPANVKLYGVPGGTGLNQYLNLVVIRGASTGSPSPGSCTGFIADPTDYISQGAGVIYSGTLANWPNSATAAQLDPTTSSPATWSAHDTHSYEFRLTVPSTNGGQGLTGGEAFTFEADNT